ncbi:MAG: hypothetical protein KKH08_01755 [Candidatus Omnitrophica bacterium]|nr:hypothetical protein [Candidatus Omnitrophota bacterium]
MNKIIRSAVAIMFMFFVASPAIAVDGSYGMTGKTGPAPGGNLISMDFQDANLKTVLKVFSQQSGLNFVAGQNVEDRTVTVYFDSVTVEDALNHIINANNLAYEQEPGSSIFIVKESGKAALEKLTKIYELKYAQLSSPPAEGDTEEKDAQIIGVLQGIISENGKIVADKRSNNIIITDVPSQFAVIEDVLARLDTRTQQVMIEAEIIETSTTVADKLGISWSGSFGVLTGSSYNTIWPLRGRFSKDTSMGEGVATAGTFNLSDMTSTLKAILSDTDTKVLARPKVLTLNNETAKIELTAKTAVASITTTTDTGSSTSTTSTGAERIDTGITLEVTPQINKDGYITMHIEPSVTVPVLSTYFKEGSTVYVDPQTRKTKSTVMVKDGETIIIGGLISKEESNSLSKIPFFGDIPIVGLAFRYKTADKADKELLIFITPRILKDNGNYALANISEREQEKPEAVREKKIESLLDLLGK